MTLADDRAKANVTGLGRCVSKLPYVSPCLSVFGAVSALTRNAGITCQDDGNNGCGNPGANMQFMN